MDIPLLPDAYAGEDVKRRGNTVIVLLCGGDKRRQDADIGKAIELAKNWKE